MSTPQQYRSGVKHRPANVAYPGGQTNTVNYHASSRALSIVSCTGYVIGARR